MAGSDTTLGPLKSRSPGAVDLGPDSEGPYLAANGPSTFPCKFFTFPC